MRKIAVIIAFISFSLIITNAQSDTLKKHNSTIAVYLSAIVPGAGQIYNGQWYKVPFFYGAIGYSAYKYQEFRLEYWKARNDILTSINNFSEEYTFNHTVDINQLTSIKETYRSFRDMASLAFILSWTFNIIDAYVNAEFYNFDVSPDLSWRFYSAPSLFNNQVYYTVTFQLKF